MAFIAERLSLEKLRSLKTLKPRETLRSLEKLNLPPTPARHLLAYLHSGDVLRHTLPRLLRFGAAIWLFVYVMLWIASWPSIYEEFERWGLVKAFFSKLISLLAAFLVVRLTLLRAGHLQLLPPDDFVNLRAFALLCRWFGEIALVYALGAALSSLLMPVGATLGSLLSGFSQSVTSKVSSGSPALLLFSSPLVVLLLSIAAAQFLVLYAIATTIEVFLAIEFNTRADRAAKGTTWGGI